MKFSFGILVIQIRPEKWRWGLVIPFPLFVLIEALEAVVALLRIGLLFGWSPAIPRTRRRFPLGQMAGLLHLPEALLRRLRDYGPMTLVDVREGRNRISVRIV